ncbi:hypothetical protein [Nonomuraea aridisoli]|uniref:Uncharacterized protein n=1 Tax=Nonomuraea aridisoli TaxID=2070368 RepID=A0A2W2EDI7_9ACTN|nr:hypothetical protein [Nonomuraea aridisoli]PZG20571.1 hypothetical protein C1J01_08695 [Nonomuraea aridisoli]
MHPIGIQPVPGPRQPVHVDDGDARFLGVRQHADGPPTAALLVGGVELEYSDLDAAAALAHAGIEMVAALRNELTTSGTDAETLETPR